MGFWSVVFAVVAVAASSAPAAHVARSPDDRAAELVEQMTLPEKVNLVTGVSVCANPYLADGYVVGTPRLGIPDLVIVGAGYGVTDVCKRPLNGKATMLPAPIAMAASWDREVARAHGALIGRESRDHGFNVAIGGDVNLVRDPRGGRTFEVEGEDPYLAGTIVAAQLRGTQDQHIPATIKHYALNNEEVYRLTASSDVDERTMRELELRAFEIGIKESGVSAVMCAYNKINGTPACENEHLLTRVLKRDWGFKGWVMSDWWACAPPAAYEEADRCDAQTAALAGLDQEQPNPWKYGLGLLYRVLNGTVPEERLDDMVHRIIRSLFASGVMDDPPVRRPIDVQAGGKTAQRLAEQSAVLLKNARDALPIDRSNVRTIAVIGGPANAMPPQAEGCAVDQPFFQFLCSSARVNPVFPDTPLEGIRDEAPRADVRFHDGADPAAAAALARRSDVAIVYARDVEAEGHNRETLALDGNADALIPAVARANKRTIVVLMTGSAVTMPWLRSVPAVLEAWYPGERGGHAIARLLFGEVNPSGRLPLTFPTDVSQLPTAGDPKRWPGDENRISYGERLLMGYRWFDAKGIKPLFPFGSGLSYGGRFRYSAPQVTPAVARTPQRVRDGHRLARFSVDVRNEGTRKATEVVQVYTGFPRSAGEPPKRLIGYEKVVLRPGQTKRVDFTIDDRSLAYWNTRQKGWTISRGDYPILVGSSSRASFVRATLRVT